MRRRIPDWLTLPRIAALFVLLVVILLVILTRLTAPPEFDFLAGPEDSTFYRDAMRFREILLRDGVKLNVVETKGTVDNLRLMLEAEGPTAAFADAVGAIDLTEEELLEDAGSDDEEDNRLDRVTSLGAIYLQPLWVFALAGTELGGIEEMDGARIGVGPEGSTSRMLTGLILRYVSGDVQTELVDIGGADETVAIDEVMQSLRSGAVDAVVAVGQPNARLVDRLLRADEFRAVRFERAAAYALHFPYLVPITLPEGGYDLGANVPNQDLHTLAASTELLVTDLFPPPLADLLLQASSEVYGEASLFTDRDAFPNPDMVSIRLNSSATRFFRAGAAAAQEGPAVPACHLDRSLHHGHRRFRLDRDRPVQRAAQARRDAPRPAATDRVPANGGDRETDGCGRGPAGRACRDRRDRQQHRRDPYLSAQRNRILARDAPVPARSARPRRRCLIARTSRGSQYEFRPRPDHSGAR